MAGGESVCNMQTMREWMREKMKRRTKRGPNNSESTGKIGQELPQNQEIAPLRPAYPDALPSQSLHSELAEGSEPVAVDAAAPEPRIEVETQPDNVGAPPPEPTAMPAGQARAPRGYVVLAIGLPGSGKTTWFKRRSVTPMSSDMLRSILFDDITEQRYQGLVSSTLRSLLRARLIAKMPWNYVDATNLSPHERRQWIKMAKSFGYDVHAVFFDVPVAVCIERNSKRELHVGEDLMQKMAERLRPPSFKEGFSKITVVRVKGSAGTAAPADEPIDASLHDPDAAE